MQRRGKPNTDSHPRRSGLLPDQVRFPGHGHSCWLRPAAFSRHLASVLRDQRHGGLPQCLSCADQGLQSRRRGHHRPDQGGRLCRRSSRRTSPLYRPSPEISKEDQARQIARDDHLTEGLIALFSATEVCLSYAGRGDPKTKQIGLVLEQAHPLHAELGRPLGQSCYWTASQTEYATDLLFGAPARLGARYPQFVHHGIRTFGCRDVLRFLGHGAPSRFRGELASDLKHRPEGICWRHRVNGNSIKVDDNQGAILRVETTIVHPEQFKVYRPLLRDPDQPLRWQRLRRSVADLYRRAEVSRAANGRYLEALAGVSEWVPLSQEAARVCRPVTVEGQRNRPLNPWGVAHGALLQQISQGQYTVQGFRNRDLRTALYPGRPTVQVARRQAAAVTRRLRLLRAHGLIKKGSGTHRWLLTERGRHSVTALLVARNADVEQLTQLAA